ncbi:exodeoxyribonuclease VII small subunit [Anoxynatronum sibiricum]|uniref:Exodeoxyribonuclease 7 small subunit n=1 Tax=Anoxynatronum sibiricum TaxID=210623 RepID=A0ABU9VQ86_9CLOT
MAARKNTYETAFKRLEEITDKLENQSLGLEESLALFQEGILLYRQCHEKLTKAEETLTVVLSDSDSETTSSLQNEMEDA